MRLLLVLLLLLPLPLVAQTPDPVLLDTIPVIGSRASDGLPLRSRSVEILDRETLQALPASHLADALRFVTGLELGQRSPAQSDLSIRGAGFENVLVLVDGVRMSDPQTGHFDLNLTLPLDAVERIEVLRGPASALYGGDAVGGVVHIVTRSHPDWTLGVEGGSFGTLRGSITGGTELPGSGVLRVSAEEGRSDGHREGTDWSHRLLDAGVHFPLGGGRIHFDQGYATRDFGAEGFYSPHPSFEHTRTTTTTLRWHGPGGIEPRISRRSHDDDFILLRDDPAVYRNQHTSTQYSGDLVVRRTLTPEIGIAVGGEIQENRLESNLLGSRSERRYALFGEAAWEVESAGLTLGLRHDGHEVWERALSPSLSGFVDLSPAVRLRAGWGRAFRGPSWTERYYVDPNHEARAELDPERSSSVEGAVVVRARRASLSLGVFRRTSDDLIDWARPAGTEEIWETRNVARATFDGLEMEGSWGSAVRLSASLLSIDATAGEGLESKYALRPLVEDLRLRLRHDAGAGVGVGVTLMHGRRPGESGFREVDFRVDHRRGIHLELRNLLGSDHLDLTGHPVAGRAVVVGYTVR
jgi:vitamin B12 transporter